MGDQGGEAAGLQEATRVRKEEVSIQGKTRAVRLSPGLGRVLSANPHYVLRQKGGYVPRVQFRNCGYLYSATHPTIRLQPSP